MDGLIVSIDIGTSKVCTMIGRVDKNSKLDMIGSGLVSCSGLKKGIIVDMDNTADSIRASMKEAAAEANLKIASAYVNIHGMNVSVINSRSSVGISGVSREISQRDIDNVLYSVRNIDIPDDRQIIDIIPREFIVDGYDEIVDPLGMVGTQLEVDADIIAGKITSVQNIIRSMEKAEIKIDGIIAEAFATGETLLTPDEKDMGVVLIDIGGGITDVSFFSGRRLVFYDSIPVGGDHITNDIAIGLRISNAEAEKIKRQLELALTTLIENDQTVTVLDIVENQKKDIKVSEIVEIIEARVYEIFALCSSMLKKAGIGNNPGCSVVLTGGGISYVDGNKQLASEVFELPVRVVPFKRTGTLKPELFTADGIVRYVAGIRKGRSTASEIIIKKPKTATGIQRLRQRVLKFLDDFF